MLIFLDFDGVLHAIGPKAFDSNKTYFSKLPIFENWLREHKDVNVVISSSWRDTMDLNKLRSFFSADIRHRVIDKCPLVAYEPKPEFWRHAEIMAWIEGSGYKGPWLAIDDAVHEFPDKFAQLVICKPHIGIDEKVIKVLTEKVESCLKM